VLSTEYSVLDMYSMIVITVQVLFEIYNILIIDLFVVSFACCTQEITCEAC
jgi:hypothetical protein